MFKSLNEKYSLVSKCTSIACTVINEEWLKMENEECKYSLPGLITVQTKM